MTTANRLSMSAAQPAGLAARGLRPLAELALSRPHGDLLRYKGGCHCDICRTANRDYKRALRYDAVAADRNPIVDASQACLHIHRLARAGVGYQTISSCADIPTSIVRGIKSGARPRARARTVKKILAVTTGCRGDAALVPAAGAWRKVRRLLEEGYTRGAIARMLGNRRSTLQLQKKRITVRNRAKVDNVYRRLMQ